MGMGAGRPYQLQTLGSPSRHHRSESKGLSGRKCPMKVGDPVQVFSQSTEKWVDGEIVKFEGNFVRIQYGIGEILHGKDMHVDSDNLRLTHAITHAALQPVSPTQLPFTMQKSNECDSQPVLDPRWLLSCKYDCRRGYSKNASNIEEMLGKNVVSNPNRFSKTCCTIVGEVWDGNYNK